MANSWGSNPIVLDSQNDDVSYDADNDAKNGGSKYSTQSYVIKSIHIVDAANGNDVVLKQCTTSSLDANKIIDLNMETSDLNKVINFPFGAVVKGICPETIDGSCKVYIWR